jgi:hypothetical protein
LYKSTSGQLNPLNRIEFFPIYNRGHQMNRLATTAFITVISALTGCVSAPTEPAATGISSAMPAVGAAASSLGLPTAGASTGLVGALVQQLGITPQQATGGAGSIFSLAKQVMAPSSFGQVSQAVPGMSQLLSAAPALNSMSAGSSGGLLGNAASMLGTGNSLGNMATLASSFQNLGLGSGMVSKFIPVILQYVQTQGGAGTMGLLQSAIMP